MNRNSPRRRAAFTLIEVMLVLLILVVLGSVSFVAYQSVQKRSMIQAAKVQVHSIEDAVKMYYTFHNRYPPNLEALYDRNADPNNTNWKATLDKPIKPDPWGQPYQYQQPGTHLPDKFDVWSQGIDNDEASYIGNW
jgi:general secretion pathway protein G